MTTTTETPVRPFTTRLLDVLRLYDGCRGWVRADVRSVSGIYHSPEAIRPPLRALPESILNVLEDDLNIRVAAATSDGGRELDMPALFARFTPAVTFDASTDWRRAVAQEEHTKIHAALTAFALPPAFLLDAGPELVALWPLSTPFAVDQDPARVGALLMTLAARLGADGESARTPAFTVPLGGAIRNWNGRRPYDHIEILDLAIGSTYSIEQIEAALSSVSSDPDPAAPAAARKRARA